MKTEQSMTRKELIAWCEDEAVRLAPVTHDYPRSGPVRLKAGDEQRAKLHAAIAALLRSDAASIKALEEKLGEVRLYTLDAKLWGGFLNPESRS